MITNSLTRYITLLILLLQCTNSVADNNFNIVLNDKLLTEIKAKYGNFVAKRIQAWQKIIINNQNITEKNKLLLVNNFFNQLQFANDIHIWKKKDYWATPFEFLIKNAGDCEDFAIAKYFTLRALHIPDNKLQIAYVNALSINQAHMVLTYFSTPQAVPLILDNLVGEILPASKRIDLVPVYSFNAKNLWKAKDNKTQQRLGDSKHLANWRELNKRFILGLS